jgi:hypothetical protein
MSSSPQKEPVYGFISVINGLYDITHNEKIIISVRVKNRHYIQVDKHRSLLMSKISAYTHAYVKDADNSNWTSCDPTFISSLAPMFSSNLDDIILHYSKFINTLIVE